VIVAALHVTMIKIQNLIDGSLRPSHAGGVLESVDPATAKAFATLPEGDASDAALAIDAARRAFPGWRDTAATERSGLLLRLADLVESRIDLLAHEESRDSGKPVHVARTLDIPRAAANLRFFATAILHWSSRSHMTDAGVSGGGRALNVTMKQPRGPAGCISPWNLPLYLLTWKIAPALATGSTVVAKPSEITPLTAFRLAELSIEAGFPPGVLNIVHGLGSTVGAAIVAHPEVPTITFTGGSRTGAEIARVAGPMFKRLSLELGGKNATILFEDVALETILPIVVRSCFANSGQICLCGSRLLVHRRILDPFVKAFMAAVAQLRIGDPLDSTTDLGPLVSSQHRAKVEACIELARCEGGRILCGGGRPARLPPRCRDGFFLEPTVIDGLPQHCRTNREEIFGPVVTIQPFDHEEEAIAIANDVPYGLAASVWTNHHQRAHRVAAALCAGTVWVNTWLHRDLRVPFGGMKESGIGREGGEAALEFFTETKNVCFAL